MNRVRVLATLLRPAVRSTMRSAKAPATSRGMSGKMGVHKHPDLERWNDVRDNVDQLYDITQPRTLFWSFIMGVAIPVGLYKAIEAEGLIPNGDGSTGVRLREMKKPSE